MTRTSSCHLLNMLAEVPDPRNKKGRRHTLTAMLALTVVGLLCGQRSYNAAISVLRFIGHTKITDALQYLAAAPKLTVNLIK